MRINRRKSFGSFLDRTKSTQIKKHYVALEILKHRRSKESDKKLISINDVLNLVPRTN